MKYRPFGQTPLKVSEIGFGGSRLGGILSQGGSQDGITVLRKALDEGINFYDTADMYSQGEGEALIGKAFQGQRDKVIIASKGGFCLPTQRRLAARIKPLLKPLVRLLGIKRQNLPSGVAGQLSQNFSPEYLFPAVEGSLRRLKTDYLDIYQLHSPPASLIESDKFSETLEALNTLKQQGKIRYFGVATETIKEAQLCLNLSGISSLQLPFGLLDPEALDTVLPAAHEKGLGVIARGCFGGGLLKDTLTEQELKEMTPKCERILELRRLSQKDGLPILQMALEYCLRVPAISVTLLGMRTEQHLQENLRFYAGIASSFN